MATYYLHQTIWDPSAETGIYEMLLDQTRYPHLYSLSKDLTWSRPYIDMERVENVRESRSNWQSYYFTYPDELTSPIEALWSLYKEALAARPEDETGHPYYDPTKIARFTGLLGKQRDMCHQALNAVVNRTKTHHEIMYNRAQDEERFDGMVAGIWKVARSQWLRMPS